MTHQAFTQARERPSTKASHKGKPQLRVQGKPQTCAGTQKSSALKQATKASHSCNHEANSIPRWREKGQALNKPKGQSPAASTKRAANLCWPHKGPAPKQATKASNSCKHKASSKPVQAHKRSHDQSKPQRQAITASTQQTAQLRRHEKGPTPKQATKASHSCKRKASSKLALAHGRAQHKSKPLRQAACIAASTK